MECVLINIEPRTSKINGGVYYRLTWVNLENLSTWETDVQDSYRNWQKNGWRDIVENKRYGYYAGLKQQRTQTRSGVGVVTADSYPELVYAAADRKTAVEIVEEEIARREKQYSNSMFDQIFAPEN